MFVVIENTPGYMPEDDDPATFEEYGDAVTYLNEEVQRFAEEIEESGGKARIEWGWASSVNLAAAAVYDESRDHDLGRWFAVEVEEVEES
jgi:hypothetical protein